MNRFEWNEFIDIVLKNVKFKYDHWDIRQEILEHMEDMYEEFVSEGMEDEVAIKTVVENMGNPEEIGIELNKEHKPFLGWIWRISRGIALIFIVLCLIPAFNFTMLTIFSVFDSYYQKTDSEMIYEVKIDKWDKSYDKYIFIDEIRYYKDGTMEVRYGTLTNPFSYGIKRNFGINGFYDEDGNRYNGSGSSGAGYYSRHQSYLRDFPSDAKRLILKYENESGDTGFEIVLPKEEIE